MLRLISGSGAGRRCWTVELAEHRFLVLEFIEGRTLNTLFSERFPLIGRTADAAAVRAYTVWALGIQAKVEQAVAALHERGVVMGDLHLFNIMVRPDDTVTLIDFEVAAPVALAGRQVLAARGFQAPRGVTGTAVDDYALACLRLALFLPLTGLLPLDRSRARALADAIRGEFPEVPGAFLDEAVRRIVTTGQGMGPARDAGAPIAAGDWQAVRSSIGRSTAAMASPERTDRLFPGDVRQFAHAGGGLGLAHGAAGVLYALHAAGAAISEEHVDWLARRAADLPSEVRLGFYDGAHGIAYALDLLRPPGRRAAADRPGARGAVAAARPGSDGGSGRGRAEPAALRGAHRGPGDARRGDRGGTARDRTAGAAGPGACRGRFRHAGLGRGRARRADARGERSGTAVRAPVRAHRRGGLAVCGHVPRCGWTWRAAPWPNATGRYG